MFVMKAKYKTVPEKQHRGSKPRGHEVEVEEYLQQGFQDLHCFTYNNNLKESSECS